MKKFQIPKENIYCLNDWIAEKKGVTADDWTANKAKS